MAGNHMSELSPRQRMINMMYLVLTALLALNISKEVLKAFKRMDNAMEYSFDDKHKFNMKQYAEFKLRAANNPEKLGEWYKHAETLRSQSNEMISMMDTIKLMMEKMAGPLDKEGLLEQKDNKEITIALLVKEKEKKGLEYGLRLKEAREKYRQYLLSLDTITGGNSDLVVGIYNGSDEIYKNTIEELFETEPFDDPEDNKGAVTWEHHKFYGHVPIAVQAFMAQMKLDVANIEGSVLELIQKKTGQSSITVNYQQSFVSMPKQSIMLGDSVHAKVFIAGVDTTQLPTFNLYKYDAQGNPVGVGVDGFTNPEGLSLDTIDGILYNKKTGQRIGYDVLDTLLVDGSQGMFGIKPTNQGTYFLGGDIVVQTEKGPQPHPFLKEYRVDAQMTVISPDKMNVLYTEVLNPVSISVPGYSSEELTLHSNFSQCNIRRIKNGTYEIKIPEQRGKNRKKEITLSIRANNKVVGKPLVFRVKNVPDPIPMVGGMVSGEMTKQELQAKYGVFAKLLDFDFEMEYEVLSYTMTYQGASGQQDKSVKGNKFTSAIKKDLAGIKRGQWVLFRDIKVKIKGAKNSKPRILKSTINIKIK